MIELCKRPMKILSLLVLLFATGNNMNLIIVNGAFTSSSPFQRTTTTTASPINQVNSKFMGRGMNVNVQYKASSSNQKNNHRRGNMSMFLGQDGILGVGAPEIVRSDISQTFSLFNFISTKTSFFMLTIIIP